MNGCVVRTRRRALVTPVPEMKKSITAPVPLFGYWSILLDPRAIAIDVVHFLLKAPYLPKMPLKQALKRGIDITFK